MSGRFHILPIYNGPESLLHGRPRFLDDYGVSVLFESQRYYVEVFPIE